MFKLYKDRKETQYNSLEEAEENIMLGAVKQKRTYLDRPNEKRTVYVCKLGNAIIIKCG